MSRSDFNYRGGHTSSANINRSNNPIIGNTGGTGIHNLNSNINECKDNSIFSSLH